MKSFYLLRSLQQQPHHASSLPNSTTVSTFSSFFLPPSNPSFSSSSKFKISTISSFVSCSTNKPVFLLRTPLLGLFDFFSLSRSLGMPWTFSSSISFFGCSTTTWRRPMLLEPVLRFFIVRRISSFGGFVLCFVKRISHSELCIC